VFVRTQVFNRSTLNELELIYTYIYIQSSRLHLT